MKKGPPFQGKQRGSNEKYEVNIENGKRKNEIRALDYTGV